MPIVVDIDELVLHGFSRADAAHLEKTITAELTRMFASADPAAFTQKRAPLVDAGQIQVQRPANIGPQVAGAIFNSVRK
jgi:hypothetical protein